jgi:hypothetical protein
LVGRLDTMAKMQALLREDAEPGPQWVARTSSACGFRDTCWARWQTGDRIRCDHW